MNLKKLLVKLMIIFSQAKGNAFIMQSVSTLFLRVIGVVTLFWFTIFLTHNFSPLIVGQYDFLRTFLLVCGSLSLLGTEQSILYYAGLTKAKGNVKNLKKIYTNSILIILPISFLFFVLVFLVGEKNINTFFEDKHSYILILRATTFLSFFAITILNTEVYRALDKIFISELYRGFFKYGLVFLGSYILTIYKSENYLVEVFLLCFLILSILSSFGVFYLFKKEIKLDASILYLEVSLTDQIKKSYPMAISGMAFFLMLSFDVIFIKKYFGYEMVAYYSTAIKLMTILSMIIITINLTVTTKISENYANENFHEIKKIVNQNSKLISLINIPLCLFFSFFSQSVLMFFGQQYKAASSALIIVLVAQAICSMFGVAPIYLNMTGRQQVFKNILIIAVVISFILNWSLVPIWGINGAAIAFSMSAIFWNAATAIWIYHKDKINIFLTFKN